MIDDIPPMPDLAGRAGTFASTGTGVLAAGASTLVGTAAGVVVGSGALAAGASPPPAKPRRQRKPRPPTLASVAKQASKAGIEVARYEIKPDGSVVVVTGTSEPSPESNPWLDDLKATKQ